MLPVSGAHGFEYDLDGKCVLIPSEGKASVKNFSRFNLKHYPVREIGGIVFAWYGEGEVVGEPQYFDIITDPSYAYDEIRDPWSVDYSRVIENQLDVSHLAFVHRTTIGRGNKTLANGPKVLWPDANSLQTSANNVVERQDKRIVETQLPKKSGLRIGENLVPADLPIIQYRKKREDLKKKP